MSFEDVYKEIENIPYEPWMPEKDCRTLYKYASKIKDGVILEIGGWAGRSGKVLSLSSPTSKIYTIDWLRETVTRNEENIITDLMEYDRHRLSVGYANRSLTQLVKETPNWELIVGDSQVLWKEWDKKIDLLVIDGSHAYEYVKNDIMNYMPFLKEKCNFLIHDAFDFGAFPGIMRAINELLINEDYIIFEKEENNYLEGQKL